MSQEPQEQGINELAAAVQDCEISTPDENSAKEIEFYDTVDRKLALLWPNPRMKPSTIFLHKTVDFAQHCKELLEIGVNFYQPYLGTNYTRIICRDFNDHKAMIHYFEQNNLPYHTFGDPFERKIKVIIRGLPKDTDLNKFKETLIAAGIPVERVNKMHMKEFAKGKDILVLVAVPHNEEGKKLLRLKKVFGCEVKLERPNPKSKQCHRCQKWGHAQRFCGGEIKCVKCAGNHFSSECSRNHEDDSPTCVNCGGNHTASYRQCHYCPDSIEYKKNQRSSRKTNNLETEPNGPNGQRRVLVTMENYTNLYKKIRNIPNHNEAVPF